MSPSNRTLKLDEVHAVRYRQPSTSRLGEAVEVTNALIILDSSGSQAQLRGLGEAQLRGVETGDKSALSWDFITDTIALLKGQTIDLGSPEAARRSVESIMTILKNHAGRYRAVTVDEAPPMSFRSRLTAMLQRNEQVQKPQGEDEHPATFKGALFGFETALLDIAAQALGLSIANLLSGPSAAHTSSPVVLPLHQVVSSQHADVMQQLKDIRQAANDAGAPVWFDFGRRSSAETATKWVQRFSAQLLRGDDVPEIVMYRPLLRRDEAQYPSIIRAAVQASEGLPSGRSVAIARDLLTNSSVNAAVGNKAQHRVIRPAAVGSLLGAFEQARQAGGPVFVIDMPGGGPIAAAALRELAAASRNVHAIVSYAPDQFEVESAAEGTNASLVPWETLLTAKAALFVSTGTLVEPGAAKFNTYPELPYLQTLGPNGTKGHLLEREALALGMNTVRYSKGAFVANDGVHEPMVFKWSRSPMSSAVALSLCTHKEATRMRLEQAGIPVPRGRTFRNGDFDTAREFADLIGFPVVVKPAMGVRGIGVVAGIANQDELSLAFEQLSDSKLGSQDFIVEKHVHGKDYRIVVVGDKVIAAILREPASVTGDGVHSIGELVLRKNAQRRLNPHLWGRPIIYDAAAVYQLERLGYTPATVLAKGDVVMLSNSCSLSQGGESFDVLDELHPSIIEACIKTVKAIPDLAFCGVDFLIEDHTKPLDAQEAGICELNAHAAIGNCEYPLYGQPRKVAEAFMDLAVERYGLKVAAQRAKQITVMIRVRGRVTGVGYRAWMSRLAKEYGITGWVRNAGTRQVQAVLSGETVAVTALVAAAVLGPAKAHPTSVSTEHVIAPHGQDFKIVTKYPKGITRVN